MALPKAFTSSHPLPRKAGTLLLVAAAALTQWSCAQGTTSGASSPDSTLDEREASLDEEPMLELEGESGDAQTPLAYRNVGDLWVHRFSGSFRDEAVILKEEVVSKKDGLITVHFTLEEGDSQTELLVEMNVVNERIIRVATLEDDRPSPGTIEDFNRMLAKTLFLPDQNEGRISTKMETCLVGKIELDCEISEYKIRVRDEEATLTVSRNATLRRDIGGEITAVDGTVLYHAELIEMQRSAGSLDEGESVAFNDDVPEE